MDRARQIALDVARASYGRLLARIAVRTREISAAEDALSDAFRRALEVWPVQGVPDRPEAWLLVVARRAFGHAQRHTKVQNAARAALEQLQDEAAHTDSTPFVDDRLKLLFVCAHPAIDPAIHTPLMLQIVLGLDTARIASAFVTSPTAMTQRLVRAKIKIRDAGIRFDEPDTDNLDMRMSAVLSAIYAAYGAGWDDSFETGLTEEAIFLARVLVQLKPDWPEARGLLALMLYCQSRNSARRSSTGAFVPISAQDATLWNQNAICEAEHHLVFASRSGLFGRFQTEAAIQSVHAQRKFTGHTDYQALVMLYDLLAARVPTLGVQVSRAAVYGEAFHPERGLQELAQIDEAGVRTYQPFWAVKAHLLGRAGRHTDMARALNQAIGLTSDPGVRAYLAAKQPISGI